MRALDAEALRQHLTGELLPLWARHAADSGSGAWFGRLGPGLEPLRDEPRRLLVQARLLWSFSEGVRLGAGAELRAAAERARAFLEAGFAEPSGDGYWLTLDGEGAPLDRTRDLYAHAFVVLALAHHAGSCGAPDALDAAARAWDWIRERLVDPEHDGFLEGLDARGRPLRGRRRQNPHMHLLEALLVLEAARPDPGVTRAADALVELLARRLVDPARGVLREHFGADWTPLAGGGEAIEPGHHFEWVWLLEQHRRARGTPAAGEIAARLWRFARAHGIADDGLVVDAVAPSGATLRGGKRLWPQTEHLKALLARGEREAAAAFLERICAAYRDAATGGWIEQLDPAGRPLPEPMRATSVYHVTLALSEAIAAGAPED